MVSESPYPDEEAWIREQRGLVEEYLRHQQCEHGGVAEYPAFHLDPYLALWAVQSKASPGAVGWWAISGDVPTDYASSADATNPRDAMRAFARQWAEAAAYMLRDEEPPEVVVGPPDRRLEFGELLHRRAEILRELAEEPNYWDEEGGFTGWDE